MINLAITIYVSTIIDLLTAYYCLCVLYVIGL